MIHWLLSDAKGENGRPQAQIPFPFLPRIEPVDPASGDRLTSRPSAR